MATSYDYPYFKTPCRIIVAGPSQCGKTTFTRQLLRSASRAFDRSVRKIVYCYGESQRCFRDMHREGIHFHHGIPKNIESLFPKHLRPGILVLDDLMRDCGEDQHVLDFPVLPTPAPAEVEEEEEEEEAPLLLDTPPMEAQFQFPPPPPESAPFIPVMTRSKQRKEKTSPIITRTKGKQMGTGLRRTMLRRY